jgi:hypothetical protein
MNTGRRRIDRKRRGRRLKTFHPVFMGPGQALRAFRDDN